MMDEEDLTIPANHDMKEVYENIINKRLSDFYKSKVKVKYFQPCLNMILDSHRISLQLQEQHLVSFKPYESETEFPIFFQFYANISTTSFFCSSCLQQENRNTIYRYKLSELDKKICQECFGLFFLKFYRNQILYINSM